MINQISRRLPLLLLLVFALAVGATAQSSPSKVRKDQGEMRISKKDRDAIISLFKGVDPSKYTLQFYNGERKSASKYGRLKYGMNDLKRVSKTSNPVGAAGYIVFVVEGDDVVYVLAVGSDNLKSVLGAQKLGRLKAIMSKYQ